EAGAVMPAISVEAGIMPIPVDGRGRMHGPVVERRVHETCDAGPDSVGADHPSSGDANRGSVRRAHDGSGDAALAFGEAAVPSTVGTGTTPIVHGSSAS